MSQDKVKGELPSFSMIVVKCSVASPMLKHCAWHGKRTMKHAAEKEQRIVDLERELKEVREATTSEKKKLEDELAEERCKVVEATAQFNTATTGRLNPYCFLRRRLFSCELTVVSRRFP
jgi:hypothetical protein